MKSKICTKCQVKKKTAEFAVNRACTDGLDIYCKLCLVGIRKDSKRRRGFLYFDPKVGFIKEDAHLYVVHNCEICVKDFYPIRSNHKRCEACSYITRDIVHHSLTGARKSTKSWVRKVSPEVVVEVSKRYVGERKCCYCNRKFTTENPKSLDHVVPVCAGGTNDSDNINICCMECNKSKAHLSLNQWIELCRLVVENNEEH